MRQHPIEDPDGDARDAQDREDRRREQGGDVVPFPLPPAIDVDELERARAAAGPRRTIDAPSGRRIVAPIRSTPDRLAELGASNLGAPPRLVVAGDVVAELERQHRRAYHRRQEKAARHARYRGMLEHVALGLVALAGAVALLALAAEFSGAR